MPLNTIYMLRTKQTYGTGGKSLESAFFYDHTAGDGNWEDLNDAFGTAIGASMNAIQSAQIKNVSIDTINMGDFTDFGFSVWAGAGAVAGEVLPPSDAYGFTFKLNTREVSSGGKRFCGVPEAYQNAGEIAGDIVTGGIETLRIALMQELVSADDTWLPVVIKRVKEPITGTVPLQYTYRLPTTDGELVVGEVVVALTTNRVKHQVSRAV